MTPRVGALAATGLAVALAACSSSSSTTPTSTPRPSTATPAPTDGSSSTPPTTTPTTAPSTPTTVAAPPGGTNPCASASTPLTAASAYLGVAELGRTDLAQRCVQGAAVPVSTTARLTAASVDAYFVPVPPLTGTTLRFRRADDSQRVTVTVARASAGFAVTAVDLS